MTTRQIVHDILRDYPAARNSDEELFLYFERNYSTETTTQEFIKEHFDFILNFRRARRYLQNTKGLFPPTEEIKRARRKKEAKIVEAIREEKKNFANHIYDYAKRIIRNK